MRRVILLGGFITVCNWSTPKPSIVGLNFFFATRFTPPNQVAQLDCFASSAASSDAEFQPIRFLFSFPLLSSWAKLLVSPRTAVEAAFFLATTGYTFYVVHCASSRDFRTELRGKASPDSAAFLQLNYGADSLSP